MLSLVASMLLATAEPAVAPPTEPARAEAKAAKPKTEKSKRVCVEEPQIGSLFPRRICATQEEWDRRAERDRAEMAKAHEVPTAR